MPLSREACVGTWRLAESYLEAGNMVSGERDDFDLAIHKFPAHFLYCHSIELALKSFLIFKGRTEKELRAIGHDLERALEEAQASGGFGVSLAEPDHFVITGMNPYYRAKELEYLVVGAKSFPLLAQIESTANSVLYGVKPLVLQPAGRLTSGCS